MLLHDDAEERNGGSVHIGLRSAFQTMPTGGPWADMGLHWINGPLCAPAASSNPRSPAPATRPAMQPGHAVHAQLPLGHLPECARPHGEDIGLQGWWGRLCCCGHVCSLAADDVSVVEGAGDASDRSEAECGSSDHAGSIAHQSGFGGLGRSQVPASRQQRTANLFRPGFKTGFTPIALPQASPSPSTPLRAYNILADLGSSSPR